MSEHYYLILFPSNAMLSSVEIEYLPRTTLQIQHVLSNENWGTEGKVNIANENDKIGGKLNFRWATLKSNYPSIKIENIEEWQ